MLATNHNSDYPRSKTYIGGHTVHAQFQDGVGSVIVIILIIKVPSISKKDNAVPKSVSCNYHWNISMQRNLKIPGMWNQRQGLMGQAKHCKSCGLMGTGMGLACENIAGLLLGYVMDRTQLFLRSKPGQLEGIPDTLLTIAETYNNCVS